jgi:hypothetical protein
MRTSHLPHPTVLAARILLQLAASWSTTIPRKPARCTIPRFFWAGLIHDAIEAIATAIPSREENSGTATRICERTSLPHQVGPVKKIAGTPHRLPHQSLGLFTTLPQCHETKPRKTPTFSPPISISGESPHSYTTSRTREENSGSATPTLKPLSSSPEHRKPRTANKIADSFHWLMYSLFYHNVTRLSRKNHLPSRSHFNNSPHHQSQHQYQYQEKAHIHLLQVAPAKKIAGTPHRLSDLPLL